MVQLAALLELLHAPSLCHLAILRPDGSLHLTETSVDTDGGADHAELNGRHRQTLEFKTPSEALHEALR